MTLKAIFGRRWVHALGLAGAAAAGYVFGITADRLSAQAPGAVPGPVADKRVVAYIYGTVPVTREELGDFLIARGGYEKLELLVNKKIIEFEAAKRNVSVTPIEVEAGLGEDLKGMGITKDDFIKHVLPRYNKSLYEWTEDVVKPRIQLGKMCKEQVKVTEEDLQRVFDNKYGERRQVKVICWNKQDLKAAQKQWDEARKGDAEFDRVARTQADPNLASACGRVAPVGKHCDTPDDTLHKVILSLKVGEISQLFETPAGIMCVKLEAIVPPDANVKLEGKLRETMEREMYDKKLSEAIPKFFTDVKKVAQPNLLLKGPPTPMENREGVNNLIQASGGAPAAPIPGPAPKP